MKATTTPQATEKAIERLNPFEWDHHRWILKQIDEAQIALNMWSKCLAQKYQLKQGDSLGATGEIIRGPE